MFSVDMHSATVGNVENDSLLQSIVDTIEYIMRDPSKILIFG